MNLTIVLEGLQEDLQGVAELGDERVVGIRLADDERDVRELEHRQCVVRSGDAVFEDEARDAEP
jgi:hypothetical protein